MQKYFFNLGRNSLLSLSEIFSVLQKHKISVTPNNYSEEILVVSAQEDLDLGELNKTLGGTVKMGIIRDEIGMEEDEAEFEKIFSANNLMENYFPKIGGKMHFGISIYNSRGPDQYITQLEKKLKYFNNLIKNNLKTIGIRAGFVQIKDRFISSVSVAKNNLLDRGAEIVLILTKDNILIGKTQEVQEFEEFSKRDYERPRKDKRSGIMPPKLARMMINCAGMENNAVLLDPFCGSGTIIQEAIYLGYKNIVGTDISYRAIADTKENIDWIFNNFPKLQRNEFNLKFIEKDVRKLRDIISGESVDTIVTEPFLGPPLFRMPDEKMVGRIFRDLERLYLDAFTAYSEILKPQGRIVTMFPSFTAGGKMIFMEIIGKIKSLGFRQIELIPNEVKNNLFISLNPRDTIIYGSRGQFVSREIIKFEKI